MKDYDYLDLKNLSFIGGQLAQKDKRFQKYAQFGYEKARQYAALVCADIFINWRKKFTKKDPQLSDLIDLAKNIVEELGISELFPTLKELTRITMIKGDSQEWFDYDQK